MADKIIIADDMERYRTSLLEIISEHYDCQVDTVPNGQLLVEQVKNAAAEKASYTVVITDQQMPLLNGLEAAAQIRAHDNSVPIILMSGEDWSQLEKQALRRGVTHYVNKQELQHLLKILDGYLTLKLMNEA